MACVRNSAIRRSCRIASCIRTATAARVVTARTTATVGTAVRVAAASTTSGVTAARAGTAGAPGRTGRPGKLLVRTYACFVTRSTYVTSAAANTHIPASRSHHPDASRRPCRQFPPGGEHHGQDCRRIEGQVTHVGPGGERQRHNFGASEDEDDVACRVRRHGRREEQHRRPPGTGATDRTPADGRRRELRQFTEPAVDPRLEAAPAVACQTDQIGAPNKIQRPRSAEPQYDRGPCGVPTEVPLDPAM